MRNFKVMACMVVALATGGWAQSVPAPALLWPGGAPGAQGTTEVDQPTLTAYLPAQNPTRTGVIIAPGGSYTHLSMEKEGSDVAKWLNAHGVAGFVLKYRLGPKYHHPVELGDAQRAIRMLRSNAAAWHIAADKIGIMGFSAGGHLAMSASTHFDAGQASAADPVDRVSSRPDFSVLGYPVISLVEPWTHQGSKNNLLGPNADPELARSLSGEQSVTKETPPTFIFQTNADTTVPAENAIHYFLALRKAGIPAEMHVFEKGPHGLGLAMDDPALSEWSKLLTNWMRVHAIIR